MSCGESGVYSVQEGARGPLAGSPWFAKESHAALIDRDSDSSFVHCDVSLAQMAEIATVLLNT